MKKFWSLFLAIILMFSLCACSGFDKDDDKDNDDEKEEMTDELEKIEDEDVELDDDDENSDDVVTTVPYIDYKEPTKGTLFDEENKTTPNFSFGNISGNSYKNDFMGLSCVLPSNWTVYNEEQILQLNNIVGNYVDDSVMEQLEKANIVYAFYAVNEATGDSLNINFEKVNSAVLSKYSNQEILESQISTIKSSFSNMGYSDVDVSYQEVTVKGRVFDALKLNGTIRGVNYYSVIISYRVGNNIVSVTVGSFQNDKTDTLLNYFIFS